MQRRPEMLVALAFVAAACVTGCAGRRMSVLATDDPTATQSHEQDDTSLTPTGASDTQEETMGTTPEATDIHVPSGAERILALAREDLARRLDLALDAIRVVSVEAVDWRDASLGCPEPGMMYAQVITPGYRVVLEAHGKRYEYHTDRGRHVVLCKDGRA